MQNRQPTMENRSSGSLTGCRLSVFNLALALPWSGSAERLARLVFLVVAVLGLRRGGIRRADRDGEGKRGAAVGVVLDPDPAAVRFHDGTADRQPHSHALGLGRVERLEHA